jgi:hypothetical protein
MSRAAKDYPLEIGDLYSDNCLCGYFSKGHHEPAAFIAAVEAAYADDITHRQVQHAWRRWEICAGPDRWVRCLNPPREKSGTRGVFPVTIAEWY